MMATFIATIGSGDFMLSSLEQAEQLLRILSAATLVDDAWLGESSKRVFYVSQSDMHVSLRLVNEAPISYEELTKLRDEAADKARAKRNQAEPA
jgi:hypothetical protein